MNQLSKFHVNNFVRRFIKEPATFRTYHALKCDFERFEPDKKEAILFDILFFSKLKDEKKGGDKECVKE
jgi:hypothetical protein